MPPTEVSAAEALPRCLETLGRFSAPGPGVTRLVYDDAWCAAQRWLASEARSLGLAATADAAGNLFFHDPRLVPGRRDERVLMVGSHLDTVKHGGLFDGPFGVVAGMLVAAEFRGQPGLKVVGFVTCEEEGSRFDCAFMGARSLLGLSRAAELDATRDAGGVSWRAALDLARAHGCAAAIERGDAPFSPLFRAELELEIHIEQGPVLEAAGIALGIVDAVAGFRRLRVRLTGQSRHAGTTPMRARRDALAAAAEIVLAAEALARELGDPAVATVGAARVEPGLYNVVPGLSELGLEVRHTDAETLSRMASELESRARSIATRRGVGFDLTLVSSHEPVALSAELAATAESLALELSVPCRRMASGAGHDTMVFASVGVPALMLFVPSRGGISHSPEEFTPQASLLTGYRFLVALVKRLTQSRPPR